MGRAKYSVEEHPQYDAIVKELIKQTPYLQISKKYGGLTVPSIRNFAKDKLSHAIASKQLDKWDDTSAYFTSYLERLMAMTEKLLMACDEWLTDPKNTNKYTLADRAEELTVCYTCLEDTGKEDKYGLPIYKTVKHSDNMQSMINQVLSDKNEPELNYVHTKRTDCRELLLKVQAQCQSQLEMMAKLTGDMKDIAVSVDVNGVIIPALVKAIVINTQGQPEIQQNILQAISDIAVTEGARNL